ncbi:hypothetical protein MXAN_2153 [Myxococcus xanthus DK 1622]|uniref:Uncharacterized protein n=2 Tax=Myxococcaceae TaxID=31 RepID=Q1DAE7_MYXXD|nr:hypothetical protein MXAN_2153 [Myxococcus xanthus DK 1622]
MRSSPPPLNRPSILPMLQVCRIPDFRKGLFGQQVALLRETFLQLTEGGGKRDAVWLNKQVAPFGDV